MSDPAIEPQKSLATLKVILSAAWADGSLQPEELPALRQIVIDLGLSDHPDLKQLVRTAVTPSEYRRYFQEYLTLHPTLEERQHLLQLMTQIIYADDEVSVEESYQLEDLRSVIERMDPGQENSITLGEFQALFSRLLGKS